MLLKYQNLHEQTSQTLSCDQAELLIGSSLACGLRIAHPFLSPEAAHLLHDFDGVTLKVLNRDGARVNGRYIPAGSAVKLDHQGQFSLFPFSFSISCPEVAHRSLTQSRQLIEARALDLVRELHLGILSKASNADTSVVQTDPAQIQLLEQNLDQIAIERGICSPQNRDVTASLAGECVRTEILDETIRFMGSADQWPHAAQDCIWTRRYSDNPVREQELQDLARLAANQLRLADARHLSQRIGILEKQFYDVWNHLQQRVREEVRIYLALRQLRKQVKDILFGYGPLEDLLRMPQITEIMVIGSDRIFVERNGLIENSGRRFVSDEVTLAVIERIVARVGRRIDKSQPIADARLLDGSRVNAVLPPLALDGPLLTVRKFPQKRLSAANLTASNALSEQAAEFLKACVIGRQNILVSGGTGTGKTTMLNCLAEFIPSRERIVTIEDTAELRLTANHVARLETRPENVEGRGEIDLADLVRNSLRMRPDRILVGECRGREALWMLQAMNTGHDGSMTTIHANSAREVVQRLEVMVQSAASMPMEAIHRQISSAINLIVHLERMQTGPLAGHRVVSEITEVLPSDDRHPCVRLKQLYIRDTAGQLKPTGKLPVFLQRLVEKDLLQPNVFFL